MLRVPWLLIAVCGWADDPSTQALVDQLAAPSAAVRNEAMGKLEERGRVVLPVLYASREAPAPDLRQRIEHVIDLIERQRLLRGTMLRLDFHDAPLADVVSTWRKETGLPLGTASGGAGTRRISVHQERPLPFWSALDLLRQTCGVGYVPRVAYPGQPPDPEMLLGQASGLSAPTSDTGPFRVHLVSISRATERRSLRTGAPEQGRSTLSIRLHFLAEPGLAITPAGAGFVEQAIDEHGSDLLAGASEADSLRHPQVKMLGAGAGLFEWNIPLNPSAKLGTKLKLLKGRVPISVLTRTGDPTEIAISRGNPTSISRRGVSMNVDSFREAQGNTAFHLKIQHIPPGQVDDDDAAPELGRYTPSFAIEDHVQVLDGERRPMGWTASPTSSAEPGKREFDISVYANPPHAPARLAYHGVVGARTEIPFVFQDITLP